MATLKKGMVRGQKVVQEKSGVRVTIPPQLRGEVCRGKTRRENKRGNVVRLGVDFLKAGERHEGLNKKVHAPARTEDTP